jgi:hypothetical protein
MRFVTRMASRTALGAAAALGVGLSVLPAQAGYVVTLAQEGKDVVATGSGSIDLTGLSLLDGTESPASGMSPADGLIVTGPTSEVVFDVTRRPPRDPRVSGAAATRPAAAGPETA